MGTRVAPGSSFTTTTVVILKHCIAGDYVRLFRHSRCLGGRSNLAIALLPGWASVHLVNCSWEIECIVQDLLCLEPRECVWSSRYFGDLVTWAAVWAVEKSIFTWRNALYFAYAVRVRSKDSRSKEHFRLLRFHDRTDILNGCYPAQPLHSTRLPTCSGQLWDLPGGQG